MTQLRDVPCLLRLSASAHGCILTATEIKRRSWASALFKGVRLTFVVTATDDDALDEWLIELAELEVPLADHFVADADVVERSANAATIELLLLEV